MKRTIEENITHESAIASLGDINAIFENVDGLVVTDLMYRNAFYQIKAVIDLIVTETDETDDE